MEAAKLRAELEACQAEMHARASEEKFEAGFLQGYVDLKRRVATDHPDLDFSGY